MVVALAVLTTAIVFVTACGSKSEEYMGWTREDWDAASYDQKSEVAKALRDDLANMATELSDFVPQSGCTSCSWMGCRWGMCQGCSCDQSFQAVRSQVESMSPSTIIESIDDFFASAGNGATLQGYVDEMESQIKQAKSAAAFFSAMVDKYY